MVGQIHGADIGTFPATGAFVCVHIPGMLMHLHGELSRLPLDLRDLSVGHQLDI